MSEADKKILDLARSRLERAFNYWRHNYQAAIDDLHFLYDEQGQWDNSEMEKRARRQRPCLQINVLPKYVKQVTGEMKQNKIQVKVYPANTKADAEISKIREGMIFDIEYKSSSESIRDQAAESQTACGFGAYRVLTKYRKDDPFKQEIFTELIDNPFSVYLDPAAKDPNYSDAKWGFIINKIPRVEFREQYPDVEEPADLKEAEAIGLKNELWYEQDNITVAEYFYTVEEKEMLALMSDDSILPKAKAEEEIKIHQENLVRLKAEGQEVDESKIPHIVKEREVCNSKIKWAKITGNNVLEKKDWAGEFIPIILVLGERINIEGKVYYRGLIRNAKDPQRMLNYWHTAAAETIALAPKAPWLVTPKMVEGFERDYAEAHQENFPYLKYNPDPTAPGVTPIRQGLGQVPTAIFAQITQSEENVKAALGMYNADVGDQGRELSGVAIQARQVPGDTATFVFPDNLRRAVLLEGKIINDLLAKIHDTEQDARVRNIDNSEQFAPINTTVGRALKAVAADPKKFSGIDLDKLKKLATDKGEMAIYNDIGDGAYDVVVTTGPSYQTQRLEAADNMIKFGQVSATMNPVDKYFTVLNMNWVGSEDYAEAIRKQIPYGILPPKAGETPPPPPPPDPSLQVAMLKLQVETERLRTERGRQMVSMIKVANEMEKNNSTLNQKVATIITQMAQDASATVMQQNNQPGVSPMAGMPRQ